MFDDDDRVVRHAACFKACHGEGFHRRSNDRDRWDTLLLNDD
jgi:hypothetical protein